MGRIKWLGLCLVAAIALGVAMSATASANENPTWTVCEEGSGTGKKYEDSECTKESSLGKFEIHELLLESEKRTFQVEAKGNIQKLDIHGNHIACKKVKFNKESTLMGGKIAKAEGSLEYEECEEEGKPGCRINGTTSLKSTTLASQMVYTTREAAEHKESAHTALFSAPKSGTVFFSGEMTGEGCTVPGPFEVVGDTLYTDIEATKHAKEHKLEISSETKYFINELGKVVEHPVTHLKDGAEENSVAILLVGIVVGVVVIAAVGWWLAS